MKANVLILGYAYHRGLMYHLVHQAVALHSQAKGTGYTVHLAGRPGEYCPGLWDSVREHFAPECVHVLDNETDALSGLVERMLNDKLPLVVHLHGTKQLLPLRSLKKRYPERLKIVYQIHSFQHRSWKRFPYALILGRMLKRYADYTIFATPNTVSRFLLAKQLFRGGRAGIVPEGLKPWTSDMLERPPSGAIDAELLRFMERKDLFKFLYLARFVPGKGHLWLTKAMASVLQRHTHARLILAGGDRANGKSIRPGVKTLTEMMGVAAQVICPGEVPQEYIPWLVHQCQVGVVPSRSETFGLNCLEVIMAGKSVIATRCGMAEWFVQDYHTGLGIEYGDIKGLERAADFMISHPDATATMGQNSRDLARRIFTWERAASVLIRIYDSIVGEHK